MLSSLFFLLPLLLLPSSQAQRGPRVVFSPCDPASPSQRFTFDGAGVLRAAFHQGPPSSPMCLDISAFNLDDNATIYTWPCGADGAGANERFTLAPASIRSQQSSQKCLRAGFTSYSGPIRAGAYLTTATCSDTDAQQALAFDAATGTISAAGGAMCVDAGVAAGAMLAPCDQYPYNTMGFCDTTLPTAARVADAVGRMSLQEKIDTMTGHFGSPFVDCNGGGGGVPSLGIEGMPNHAECLHGVAAGCAMVNGTKICPTLFPNGQMLGAGFNRTLWKRVGAVIGREMRALQNLQGGPSGFSCWSPDLNLARDPRWGRAQEVPGEDPYLHSEYGVAYATGMQVGEDTRYVLTVSSPKHCALLLLAAPRKNNNRA